MALGSWRPAGTLGRALLVLAGWLAITVLAAPDVSGGDGLVDLVTHGVARQVALAAAFVLAAALLVRWRDPGLGAPRWRSLWLLWFPGLYVAAMAAVAALGTLPPAPMLGLLLVNTTLVGLSEETMFRGVLLSALNERLGLRPAIAVSTVGFGIVHVLNVFLTGSLAIAVAQACAAMASGLLLVAIRLRSGSLWPAVAYHAVWDFVTFAAFLAHMPAAGSGDTEAALDGMPLWAPILPVAFILPIGVYGLFLLRRLR